MAKLSARHSIPVSRAPRFRSSPRPRHGRRTRRQDEVTLTPPREAVVERVHGVLRPEAPIRGLMPRGQG